MTAQDIINQVSAAKNKNGFVTVWRVGEKIVSTATLASFVIRNAQRYADTGAIVTHTDLQKIDRNHLPEQLLTHLSIQEEQNSQMQEDNDLDEQFWRRDA